MENVIIIGSGPAGYTAAIYAARANLKPLMIEGLTPGGQLMITTDVENYPGFDKGVTGPELMEIMKKQAARFDTRFVTNNVTKVDFSKRPFKVWVEDEMYEAQTIIIATGASAKWLGIPSEQKYMGKGASACATCDGAFFKKVDVVVVGGGDTAMEESSFLTRFANKVYLVHRRDQFRASKIMQDRVLKNPKIEPIYDSTVDEILGEKSVQSVRIKNIKTGKTTELKAEGYFVAIGHKPNTDIFKGIINLNETGYIITKPGTTQTNVAGVYAAGDVQDHVYRQAVTAAGTGCMAALEAERFLEANHS
ncbi:MAG: thioredoxin-disulfide reductase [Oligoflexia bacterium]|nr:thioredoxin-disulfide reductase [Oligoflexia bacterium]